jgi:hypothetical protein
MLVVTVKTFIGKVSISNFDRGRGFFDLWDFLASSRNLKEGATPDWAAASAFPIFFSSPFTNNAATYTKLSEIQSMLT